MAAGAAGVGMLALAPPANADVVYTRANMACSSCGLDFNHDGVVDLRFGVGITQVYQWVLTVLPGYPATFVSTRPDGLLVGPLPAGYTVGPGKNFINSNLPLLLWRSGLDCAPPGPGSFCFPYHASRGPWEGKGFADLGLYFFTQDGGVHYGYAMLSIPRSGQQSAPSGLFIEGYAYETVANKPILTTLPEPGTLGLLALGSLGIAAWRRKKPVTSDK